MNRQQRRDAERKGETPANPATPADAKRFIDQSFTDRISWIAARVLLERVTNDVGWRLLEPDLRDSIATFLERHPAPVPKA